MTAIWRQRGARRRVGEERFEVVVKAKGLRAKRKVQTIKADRPSSVNQHWVRTAQKIEGRRSDCHYERLLAVIASEMTRGWDPGYRTS